LLLVWSTSNNSHYYLEIYPARNMVTEMGHILSLQLATAP
jgi:hypothetical protein